MKQHDMNSFWDSAARLRGKDTRSTSRAPVKRRREFKSMSELEKYGIAGVAVVIVIIFRISIDSFTTVGASRIAPTHMIVV